MTTYTSDSPVFSSSLPITETSDPAHADNINAGPKQVFENTLVLKKILGSVLEVPLPADGWEGDDYPYTQTVQITGMTDADEPIMVSLIALDATEDEIKAYQKAYGQIYAGMTSFGSATFYAREKPETDITVGLKLTEGTEVTTPSEPEPEPEDPDEETGSETGEPESGTDPEVPGGETESDNTNETEDETGSGNT